LPGCKHLLQSSLEIKTMPSKTIQLEQRLSRLEKELDELKATVAGTKRKKRPWWQEISGTFKNDPLFDEIVRRGAAIRQRTRRP
jgi:SMC interacting uncharacterized protein involved in chromosome segregation